MIETERDDNMMNVRLIACRMFFVLSGSMVSGISAVTGASEKMVQEVSEEEGVTKDVPEETSQVSLKEESDTETVPEETSQVPLKEESDTETVPEEMSQVPLKEESDTETVPEESPQVPLEEESDTETAPEETPQVSLEEESDTETVPEEETKSASTEGMESENDRNENDMTETIVPFYNDDIVNVVVPARFSVAFNPYEFQVKTGDGSVSAAQVISRNYGIVNKSSTDKIVTVSFMVEDLNKDKITFVDSAEAALNAGKDTYAVYLTMVPSDNSDIGIEGKSVNEDTAAGELSDVTMVKAENQAVALHSGANRVAFKLSKAVYSFDKDKVTDGAKDNLESRFELLGLAPGGAGVTAFTFDGVLNKNADWSSLSNGIKISAVYTYETAKGGEKIADGTGAMIKTN